MLKLQNPNSIFFCGCSFALVVLWDGLVPCPALLQVRALLCYGNNGETQVTLFLQARHCLVQALPQRSELQPQLPQPQVWELVRLRHGLAVVFTPARPRQQNPWWASKQRPKWNQTGWKYRTYLAVMWYCGKRSPRSWRKCARCSTALMQR